jgi:hypothetical protein
MAKKVTGGCACGFIRYQLLDKPMFVHCCHCDDCQRLTGSAFVLNAIIETQAIKLLCGKPVAVPVPRENGPHDIYRCPRCHTAVWSDYGRKPNVRFVRVGTLDKPGALKPDVHVYTRWKAKWLKLPKRTPSFRDYYNTSNSGPRLASNASTPPSAVTRNAGEAEAGLSKRRADRMRPHLVTRH